MKHLKLILLLPIVIITILPLNSTAQNNIQQKDEFQQQTLFKGKVTHGGFGAVTGKISTIKNKGHVLAGLRGAWLINHALTIGGAGYGVTTDLSTTVNGTNKKLHMGYGGFELGHIFKPANLIHLKILTLVGAGGIGYGRKHRCDDDDDDNDHIKADVFFVLEPMAYLEMNITTWFHLCMGGGYRYVDGVNKTPHYSNKDLSGPSIELMLKFGKF